MPPRTVGDDRVQRLIVGATGICVGVSIFFLLLPFLYSPSATNFPQWLEGLAGPLGFASLSLIALTTYLQQEQQRHTELVEQALMCDRFLETYHRLLDHVEIISAQQHAALPDYRRGSRAFALLKAEYDRRVAMIWDDDTLSVEKGRFIRKYKNSVAPFVDLMVALMEKTHELEDPLRIDAISRRAMAIAPAADREMLILFCPPQHADKLREWLGIS